MFGPLTALLRLAVTELEHLCEAKQKSLALQRDQLALQHRTNELLDQHMVKLLEMSARLTSMDAFFESLRAASAQPTRAIAEPSAAGHRTKGDSQP